MNVKAMRRADRWLGVPLCFVLSVARRLFGGPKPDCALPPRSFLFVKLAEQGSTVLAYPALKRAIEIAGRENVHFIVFEDNRFILDALAVIPAENVITISVKGLTKFLWTMFLAIRRLRRLKVEAAVDMEFFARGSAALTYLSGARRRAGFHAYFGAGPYRGDLMSHRVLYNPHVHTSSAFLTLMEALNCDPTALPTLRIAVPVASSEPPAFTPSAAEVAEVRELLGRETRGHRPLILLNPNGSDLLPLRRWPLERYVELARRFLAQYPEVAVAFTGAAEEASVTAELVRQVASARCVCLAGKTTLRQLLVLYTLAEVLVTNDSGPAHFATLTPVRVITLFGPETPELFGARTPRNTALWAGLACSPCVNAYNNRQSKCRENLCMQALTVDEVFRAGCCAFEAPRGSGRFAEVVNF